MRVTIILAAIINLMGLATGLAAGKGYPHLAWTAGAIGVATWLVLLYRSVRLRRRINAR